MPEQRAAVPSKKLILIFEHEKINKLDTVLTALHTSIRIPIDCNRPTQNTKCQWGLDGSRKQGTPFHTNLYGHNPELKELSELITGNIFFLKLNNGKSCF